MTPYLIIFAITVLLGHIADKCYNSSNRKAIYVLSLILILIINVIFAGSRDFGVGIDTTLYIDYYYELAKFNNSFISCFTNNEGNVDLGFLCLAKLSTYIGNDSQSLLYMVAFFIYGFFILGCHKLRQSIDFKISVFMLLFCLLHYCPTENLMRQYCAMALLFYGFAFLINNNAKYYLILQILAFFFHSSSVVFLTVVALYYVSLIDDNRKRITVTLGIFLSVFLIMISYYYLSAILGNMGGIYEVYSDRYGLGSKYESERTFSVRALLSIGFWIPFIIPFSVIIFAKNKNALDNKEFYMLSTIYILSFLIQQSSYIMIFFGRFTYYFSIIYMIYLAKVFSTQKLNPIVPIYYLLYIYHIWSFHNFDEIMESYDWSFAYTSKILGIN